MLQLQYLRGILLVNNLVSLIIAFVQVGNGCCGWYWQRYDRAATYITMGTFLIISWLMSFITVVYTKARMRKASENGYFRIPLTTDYTNAEDSDALQGPQMGAKMSFIVAIADLCFSITFPILATFGFLSSNGQPEGVACVGAIVAAVVHIFFSLEACYRGILSRYTLKVSIVRRDQKTKLNTMSGAKEQSPSEVSSMQEPEPLSPRPYRGSPSTKPSQGTQSDVNNPIRFIEPTEGDSLIADHD